MFLVWLLLKNAEEMTGLQQNVLVLEKHGEHLSLNSLPDLIRFLLCSTVLLPMNCLIFEFLQKAIIGDAWNISLNSEMIYKMCQCFLAIGLTLDGVHYKLLKWKYFVLRLSHFYWQGAFYPLFLFCHNFPELWHGDTLSW